MPEDRPARITRHVTKRDGRLEGEPDVEEDADATEALRDEEERQRDLTSLSGPGARSQRATETAPKEASQGPRYRSS